MRKRAQRKSIPVQEKYVTSLREEPEEPKRWSASKIWKKNWWVTAILIGIFCLVLLNNAYFNASSEYAFNPNGERLSERYYLSGPDPYYNMRMVEQTLETGHYQFYSDRDPLLDYPLTHTGQRAPLLNMMAIGFSRLLVPTMGAIDATGFAMQFVPSLFGALLIFPVYYIGKTVFGKKEGLLAALFIALVPIHLGSGHGSAFALFDHDSLNLLLFFITFAFLIKAIREQDRYRMILYSLLGGLGLAGLTMVWVEAQFLYAVIAVYAIVQMLFDIFTNKIELRSGVAPSLVLLSGYLISFPVQMARYRFWNTFPDFRLYIVLGVIAFGIIYLTFHRKRLPWTISLPAIFSVVGVSLVVLYLIDEISQVIPAVSPLRKLHEIIWGQGIYGSKVAMTIAEANTYGISRTWVSYNPMLLLLAFIGLGLLLYFYFKPTSPTSKMYKRRDFLFLIILCIINIWLTGTAGRFLNDFVPVVVILAAWVLWMGVKRFNYQNLLRNIRNAGGGLRGIRKGVSIYQVLGVLLLVGMFMVPKVGLAHLALDAAIPPAMSKNGSSNLIDDFFGDQYAPAFGSNVYTEIYWVDAFSWLNEQDRDIENPWDRPAVISWWDYGFYEVAVGGHPTVADNFQDGIPPASNFHTSQNETEGVAVWCVRLIEGALGRNDEDMLSRVETVITDHYPKQGTTLFNIIKDPKEYAPSYDTLIGEQYDNEIFRVRDYNAKYHDAVDIITSVPDENVTWFYHDIQEATGFSIRYYAVEGYDINIFGVFTFLSDKGVHRYSTLEDDFFKTVYVDRSGNEYTVQQLENMSQSEIQQLGISNEKTTFKDAFYNSMVYQTYLGPISKETFEQYGNKGNELLRRGYAPTAGMKHFAVKYISPLGFGRASLCQECPAVIIAKYYEGAYLNGTIAINNTPAQFVQAVIYDEFGIPHDNVLTDDQGKFNLLIPGGNITLRLSYANQVILKDITFNSTKYPPISDDEAMRRVDDFTRELNLSIPLSTLDGYVYEDVDGDGKYNLQNDTPLSGVVLELTDEFGLHPSPESVTTDDTGYYSFDGLFPSKYTLTAIEDGFELYSESITIEPENKTINISKPMLGGITGVVYFDEDMDEDYDEGTEEMSDVAVNLIYGRTNEVVGTQTTDASGFFSFSQLIPGDYIINASKMNPATGYLDYFVEDDVTIQPNATIEANLSIGYATIKVSGVTQHSGQLLGSIPITFEADPTDMVNNTAEDAQATSKSDGSYEVELIPGDYNVYVEYSDDQLGTYSFVDTLTLTMGQGVYSYLIGLEKETVSVDGVLTAAGHPVANLTIDFIPVIEQDNTAVRADTQADATGSYHIELMPGAYNVTIDKVVNESGTNVHYTIIDRLDIDLADDPFTYDIMVTREIQ